MATVDTSVNELIINKLTQEQYDNLAEKSSTELYFVTDAEVLPDQADNAGKFLATDGENLSWESAVKNNSDVSQALAVGHDTRAESFASTSIGAGAVAESEYGVAMGYGAWVTSDRSDGENILTRYSTALGYSATVTKPNSVALVSDGGVYASQGVAIGYGASTRTADSISIGNSASTGTDTPSEDIMGAIAIGKKAEAKTSQAVAIGTEAKVVGDEGIAVGNSSVSARHGIALGTRANANDFGTVSIGLNSESTSTNAVAIGNQSYARGQDSVALGSSAIVDEGAGFAVQLGVGTNYDANTLQFRDYKVLYENGIMPYERLSEYSPSDGQVLMYDDNEGALVWREVGGDYELPTASAVQLGGVKVGSGLSINSNGVLSANVQEGAKWGSIKGNWTDQTDLKNVINDIKTTESNLQSQIDSLSAIGQFLAIWDCDTHIARYLTDGYEYQAGNYFIVGTVASEGGVNYAPDGAVYPGYTETTEDVKVSDMFFYDGAHWVYLANHERSIAVDADLDKESTNPVENKAVATAIEELQNRPTGVGVPQLASVDVLQVKTPEQQEERRLNYTDWMGEYSDIIVTLNLNKQDLLDKMYDLYITISRFKTNKNLTYKVDEEEFRYRNISKFSVMNDLRQKTDIRLYCWRFVTDSSYAETDPRRYVYMYTKQLYADGQALLDADPVVGLWSNVETQAGIATCFNAICWAHDNSASVVYGDMYDEDTGIERYEEGDISEFANLSNSANYPEYNISNYVTKVECRKYTKDGQNYFFWCADWSNENSEVYCTADNNGLPTPNGIPVHMDELAQIYYVRNLAQFNYEFVEKRPDLNYKEVYKFDTLLKALEEMTFRGKYVAGEGRPTYWGCYWFDYPVMPVLLKDCEVRPHQQSNLWTGWKKLEDVIKEGLQNQLIDGMPIELKLPYNTYYLWMRFCSLQKRCAYGDYSNWLDEEGRGIDNPMWPYQKHNLKDGVQNYNVLGRRAYARPRQAYRINGESSKISEYILFNVCTPMDVASGSKSKSTPIQKKLNIDMKAKTGLRD